MNGWHILAALIALMALLLWLSTVLFAVRSIDQYEKTDFTTYAPLAVGVSDKQITVDATEIQGGHYFSR